MMILKPLLNTQMICKMLKKYCKKLNPIVTELLIRGRKLNISVIFITQSYFKVPKKVRLNTTHFFISKIKESFQI